MKKKVSKKKKVNFKKKYSKLKKTLTKKIKQLKKKFTTKKKTKKEPKKKIDIKTLTSTNIEEELKREKYKSRYLRVLKSTAGALLIIAAASALLATFFMPVFEISGTSMQPRFNSGEIVISVKQTKLERGDVIAFYHGNKILIKRVIAGAGAWINIDQDGNVYVDGLKIQENYISEKYLGETNIEFPYQVPDGSYFVLSDVRKDTQDSRNSDIGCIPKEDIIGKIVFKVWPINSFGFTN